MSGDIVVCEKQEKYALTLRKIISYDEIPEEYDNGYRMINNYLKSINITPSGDAFAIYHNTHMDKVDVEIGFPVADETEGKGDILKSKTVAGKAAESVFKGPYTRMEPVYNKITNWIIENNYHPTGVVYEEYLNDPGTTPPEELLTRIGFILEKTE